ncbi:MAG: hypothetical protein HY744_19445 [Deltaproteobacteria bacterium]|nr:hypothetical protein [Deltaproteobacteria bacterium]
MLAAIAAGALLASGCTESDDYGSAAVPATQIGVDPADFLGEVACNANEGSAQAYVVTPSAWEDGDDAEPFALGSSPPTPCAMDVLFRDVIAVGTLYTAEVDVYDVPAAALRPFGGASSGARVMLDASIAARVEPRWSTGCGTRGDEATPAELYRTVLLRPCDPLGDGAPAPAAILLEPDRVLGAQPCWQAESYDVLPGDPGLAAVVGTRCDGDGVRYEPLEDGRGYAFYVAARSLAELPEPDLGTECFAEAAAGQVVRPICSGLSGTGGLRLWLGDLSASGQPVCPAGQLFDVQAGGEMLNPLPLPCEQEARVEQLVPGPIDLDIVVYDPQGEPFGPGAACFGQVLPGTTAAATCQAAR